MIVVIFILVGAALGALTARRRGGAPLDMVQYAAGYGIAFGLVAVLATILVQRLSL